MVSVRSSVFAICARAVQGGRIPLLEAASHGCVGVVSFLIDSGVDINAKAPATYKMRYSVCLVPNFGTWMQNGSRCMRDPVGAHVPSLAI